MNSEERLWDELAGHLVGHFIYGNHECYEQFEKVFDKYFDYDVKEGDEKFIHMKKIVRKDSFSPIDYIYELFRINRGEYKKEYRAVLGGCKYCYKLKNENERVD